jgi:hypothetical protein
MKDRSASRHPGPFRIMQVDSEIAGLLVAVGFLVMGFVSMPVATGFVIGAVALGMIVALALRFTPKKFTRVVLGAVIVLAAVAFWWDSPRRPHTVSSNALYVLPNNVPFTLRKTGYWLECWFDGQADVDRCRLTDEHGTVSFEDVFLQCEGCKPLPQSELVIKQKTGRTWIRSCDKKVNVPVIYVAYGLTLLPQSFYAEAKGEVYCSP